MFHFRVTQKPILEFVNCSALCAAFDWIMYAVTDDASYWWFKKNNLIISFLYYFGKIDCDL